MTREESVFAVLADPRRRWTLGVVALTPQDSIPVRDLAHQIALYEFDEPTTRKTKHVRTSLRRSHLDRLESIGAVRVAKDRVSPGPNFQSVYRVLSAGLCCDQSYTE